MEKDKADERMGHLMVNDHRRPRPCVITEELQVRSRPLPTVKLLRSPLSAGFFETLRVKCRN